MIISPYLFLDLLMKKVLTPLFSEALNWLVEGGWKKILKQANGQSIKFLYSQKQTTKKYSATKSRPTLQKRTVTGSRIGRAPPISFSLPFWFPKAIVFVILLGIVGTAYGYFAYGAKVKGRVTSFKQFGRFCTVLTIPNHPPTGIIKAKIARADATGHFEMPSYYGAGTLRFILLNSNKTQLLYLTAVRDKTLFTSLDLFFETEAEEHDLIGTEVNRFIFDKSELPGHGPAILNKVFTIHPEPQSYYVIIGHTDKVGDPKRNERLGENRAMAAAVYLESLGVPRNHLIIASLGSIESQTNNQSDTLDRRVQVLCIPNPYGIADTALGQNATEAVGSSQKN